MSKKLKKRDKIKSLKSKRKDSEDTKLEKELANLRLELQETEKQLDSFRNHFYALFELSKDAIIIMDLDGNYLMANQNAAELFGFDRNNLSKIHAFDFINVQDVENSKEKIKQLLKGEDFPIYERRFITSSGKEFIGEINISLVKDAQGKNSYIQSIIRDITSKKETEQTLDRDRKLYEEIAFTALQTDNLKIFCNKSLQFLLENLDFEFGTLRIFDNNLNAFTPIAVVGLPPHLMDKLQPIQLDSPQDFIVSYVLKEKKPIFASNVYEIKELASYKRRFEIFDIKSLISWPIFNREDKIIGAIQLSSTKIKNIPEKDKLLFETVTKFFSIALEKLVIKQELTIALDARKELNEIINLSPAIVFLWRNKKNFPVEYVSENIVLFGYTPEDFYSGRVTYRDLIHPDYTRDEIDDVTDPYNQKNEPYKFPLEYCLKTRSGDTRWVIEYSAPRTDIKGTITHFHGIILDITKRKFVEDELKKSEIELERIFDYTGTATAIVNNELVLERCNQQFENLLEISKSEIINSTNWLKILPDESKIKLAFLTQNAIFKEQREIISYEINLKNFKQHEVFGLINIGFLPDSNKFIISVIDITDHKRAEQTIKRERLAFKVIVEASLYATNVKDFCKKVLREFTEPFGFTYGIIRMYDPTNRTLERVTHVNITETYQPVEPIISIDRKDLFHAEVARSKKPIFIPNIHSEKLDKNIRERLDNKRIKSFVTWPILDNQNQLLGVLQLVSEKTVEFIDKDYSFFESIVGLLSTALERIQTENDLTISEERFRNTVDNMNDGMLIIENGKTVYVNDRALEIIGYPKDELMKFHRFEMVAPEDKKRYLQETKLIIGNKIQYSELEHWLIQKNGNRRYIMSRQNIKYIDGKPLDMFILITDLTEKKIIEDNLKKLNEELERRVEERTSQLAQVNKELEAFSYSVSHDLRTPLRSIDGFSQALAEDYIEKIDDKGKDFITRIRAATKRMSLLIDNLLSLSRLSKSTLKVEKINLSKMVQEVIKELQTNDKDRKVIVKIQDNIKVEADPNLLRTMIENLIGNAWKFTNKKIDAKIEFGRITNQDETIYFIKDNGAGFNQDYVDKIFEAFQRLHTYSEFPGTGVGLVIVQRIIDRHKGKIWAVGEIDKGATFYFTLP